MLIGSNKEVLDVGAGDGSLAEYLQKLNCKVVAIEKDADKAIECRGKRIETLTWDVENGIRLDQTFDIVLFADILEHLKNPSKVLRDAQLKLKKDGHIIASFPNVANWKIRLKLLAGNFDYTEQGILDTTHLRFYTRKTARELLESAGYEIEEVECVPSFPFPYYKNGLSKVNSSLFSYQFVFMAKRKTYKPLMEECPMG